MPDLTFQVEGADAVPYSASPLIAFKLRIRNAGDEAIHSVLLRCQIQIETTRRRYAPAEQSGLRDLFGEPERWGQTLRAMLWTNVSATVPPFSGETLVDLAVPCTFDFNAAVTKYMYSLEDGEIPVSLLFSGTVFYESGDGALLVAQIPWEREAAYRLAAEVWRKMMDFYYPNSAWLCIQRDVFDRLYRFKVAEGIATWEQTLERLLPQAEGRAAP